MDNNFNNQNNNPDGFSRNTPDNNSDNGLRDLNDRPQGQNNESGNENRAPQGPGNWNNGPQRPNNGPGNWNNRSQGTNNGSGNGNRVPQGPNNGPDNWNNGPQGPNNGPGNRNNPYDYRPNPDDDGKGFMGKGSWIPIMISFLIMMFMVSFATDWYKSATTKEINYSEFIELVQNDKVDSVVFDNGKIFIEPKEDATTDQRLKRTFWTTELYDITLIPMLEKADVKFKAEYNSGSGGFLSYLIIYMLPIILLIVGMTIVSKKMSDGGGGFLGGVGKSNAKRYAMQKETGITFKDVAGQDEAKESVYELVDFLHNPDKYAQIGAKLPKGALLVGPPGTGKTLLAKAVAGEANVPFFSISGSDFVEMFVGVGASRVRDLFKQAQQNAPCIIFIDEIDAIGKSRDSKYGGGNDEREQTLNQLLSEMDGFDTSKGILILAATNRPEVLDPALLRPGRFDRRVIVDKPDLKGRLETLKVHSKGVAMDETVDLDAIALATSGAVGSDLANMINEAAINAVKHGRRAISQDDLFESVEVVIAGKEKKDRILGEQEKRTVAYHEVGHALVTALQKHAEPVQKITIVPRTMGSLGYVMQVPEEEKYLMTKKELDAKLVTLLAGRAAEEIVFDTVTTGASNDIERATSIAKSMIAQFGMSEKLGLMSVEHVENPYLGGQAQLNCSQQTAAIVEEEVKKMLEEKYQEAKELLEANRAALDKIADFLYEKETITGQQFMEILNSINGTTE